MFRIKNAQTFIKAAGSALYREYKKTQTPQFQADMVALSATKAGIQIDQVIEYVAEQHGSGNIEYMRSQTFSKYRKEALNQAYELARCLGNEQAKEYFGENLS